MNLERLKSFFNVSPSAKLLRSPHAPYILDFLNRQFKTAASLPIPHSRLVPALADYLEQIHEIDPDPLRDRAETYLTDWSTGETRWLRRFFDTDHSEPVYQLTPATEDVLTFLTEVLDRNLGFVGTESRLSRIIATLADITVRGSDDREKRLEHLRAERERIDAEIEAIEAGEEMATHSPTAIRERFADAVSDLISLQGDFRAVEESFKSLTRDVQQRQADASASRGTILGYALDAEEELKNEDQGVSFQAFVRLILSQSRQDELERLISQLDQIEELAAQIEGRERIKGMIASLSAEAERVLRVTRRLNATLRRLLDTRGSTTRQRLAEVLGEIRVLAAQQSESPPEVSLDVFAELDLANVHQRSFWEGPVEFAELPLSHDEQADDDRLLAFRDLAAMRRLDWVGMRGHITQLVRQRSRATLAELLRIHPPRGGVIEVLGYVQLAHDDGHEVDPSRVESIEIPGMGRGVRRFEVPHVVFVAEQPTALVARGEE